MADEFGGEIPVAPFSIIGDESIGRAIVDTLTGHRSRAVLLANHGVFTIGQDARDAVKAAVMCEDSARTVHLARQLGTPVRDRAEQRRRALRSLPERLRTSPQGSHVMGRSIVPDLAGLEVWFLTGSQTMYGDAMLAQVASQSQSVANVLDQAAEVPCRIVWKPVLTSREAILETIREANASPTAIGIITWMHTFSPAKMWIAGLSALDKPMLHLHTQANLELPWASIDFDFMNLNQAAHGDREFGYIETRLGIARTTVVGHASDPTVTARIGDWCRAAAGWSAARRLSVARFGDNMRYVAVTEGDKTEAEAVFGSQINTWGVMDLATLVEQATEHQIDALVEEYLDLYDVVACLLPGADRHDSLRYGASIEVGLANLPRIGRIHRLHDIVRGPRHVASAPWASRATADGRWVRLRRRGRLEDGDAREDRGGDGGRSAQAGRA